MLPRSRGPRSCGLRWCFHPERGAVSTPCERSSSAWNRTCTLPTTVLREPFLRHPQQQKVPGRGTGRRSFPAHFPPTGQGEHSCDAKYTQLYKWPGQHKERIWPRRPWNRGRSRREPRERADLPRLRSFVEEPCGKSVRIIPGTHVVCGQIRYLPCIGKRSCSLRSAVRDIFACLFRSLARGLRRPNLIEVTQVVAA